MILPGVVEQLADEDRGNFLKLLGLLTVLLVGCGFWTVVWRREHSNVPPTDGKIVQSRNVDVPATEIAQRVASGIERQR
ncbi:MAG: hypothetical protein V4719_17260 [Planctomycetota bacterium]